MQPESHAPWQRGYEAALEDLQDVVEQIRQKQGLADPHLADGAEMVASAIRMLRRKLAQTHRRPEPDSARVSPPPDVLQREWT